MENYSSLNIRGCEVTRGANVSCLTRKYQDKFSKQFLTTRKLQNVVMHLGVLHMWIVDLWNLTSWRYEKNILCVVSRVELTQVLIFNFCNTCSQTLFCGSFCRYRGTDYIQQKKQHNLTIKLLGELYCLVPLFFCDDRTCWKTPL